MAFQYLFEIHCISSTNHVIFTSTFLKYHNQKKQSKEMFEKNLNFSKQNIFCRQKKNCKNVKQCYLFDILLRIILFWTSNNQVKKASSYVSNKNMGLVGGGRRKCESSGIRNVMMAKVLTTFPGPDPTTPCLSSSQTGVNAI